MFLKKPKNHISFGFYWVFGFFYLNEQWGSLLVDSAYQLSFKFCAGFLLIFFL